MSSKRNKTLVFSFLLSFCLILSSCNITENVIGVSAEVDFSTPHNVQIYFNEKIYNTSIVFNKPKLEINFTDEKDLLGGAYVCLQNSSYKITYKDMIFEGDRGNLIDSFLPCIIYSFLASFENKIILDSFDKEKNCIYVKRNINDYFIVFECFETENGNYYSMKIK